MVLIKNDGELLPLDLASGTRVAVVGPNANAAFMMGGGSSQVRAQRREPLLSALRRHWGSHVEIVYESGVASNGQPTPTRAVGAHEQQGRARNARGVLRQLRLRR